MRIAPPRGFAAEVGNGGSPDSISQYLTLPASEEIEFHSGPNIGKSKPFKIKSVLFYGTSPSLSSIRLGPTIKFRK